MRWKKQNTRMGRGSACSGVMGPRGGSAENGVTEPSQRRVGAGLFSLSLLMKRSIFIAFFVSSMPNHVNAQVYLTRDEALRLHLPRAMSVDRKTLYLTDEQVQKIQGKARARVESKLVTYYVGHGSEGVDGYAFLETQILRTMPETFMVVVNPDGSVRAVEILAFYEPKDYLPPKGWLALFTDKRAQSDLWLKRGVQNIVGATLSAQSITEGVRRILAMYELVIPKEK